MKQNTRSYYSLGTDGFRNENQTVITAYHNCFYIVQSLIRTDGGKDIFQYKIKRAIARIEEAEFCFNEAELESYIDYIETP